MEPPPKAAGGHDPLAIAIRLTKALRHASRTPLVARGVRWSWTVLTRVSSLIVELLQLLDRPDSDALLLCSTFRSHVAGFQRFASGIRSAELEDDKYLVHFARRFAIFHRRQIQKRIFPPTSLQWKTLDKIASACYEICLGAIARHPENLDLFVNSRAVFWILLTDDIAPPDTDSMLHARVPDLSSGILMEPALQFSLSWAPGECQASLTDLEGLSSAMPDATRSISRTDDHYDGSAPDVDDEEDQAMEDVAFDSHPVDLTEICKRFQLRHSGCSKLVQACANLLRPEMIASFSDVGSRCSVVADSVCLLLRIITAKYDDVLQPALEMLSNTLSAYDFAVKIAFIDELGNHVKVGDSFVVIVSGLLQIIERCSSGSFALDRRAMVSARVLRSFIAPHSSVIDKLISLTQFPLLHVNHSYLLSPELSNEVVPWSLSPSGLSPAVGESSTICNRILQSIALSAKLVSFVTFDTLVLIDQSDNRSCSFGSDKSRAESASTFPTKQPLLEALLGLHFDGSNHAGESAINFFDILSLLSVMAVHMPETDDAVVKVVDLLQTFVKFTCLLLPRLRSNTSSLVFQNFSQKTLDILFGMSLLMSRREDIRSVDFMDLLTAVSSHSELTEDMRFSFVRSLLNDSSDWIYDVGSYSLQFVFRISVGSKPVRSFLISSLMAALSIQLQKPPRQHPELLSHDHACIFLLSLFSELGDRQTVVSQLLQFTVQKTSLSFASVMNHVDAAWISLLFLTGLSVQFLRSAPLSHSSIASCCALLSKAPRLDMVGFSNAASSIAPTLVPDLSWCQGIANCDQFCDRLFHLAQDVSRKIHIGFKNDVGLSHLSHYQSQVLLLVNSLLGLLTTGSDNFSVRYGNLSERSAHLDCSSPIALHFIQQCAFRMRLDTTKLLPPDPVMWLLDVLNSTSRFASQNAISVRYWWVHLGVDVAVNALSYHLLHDEVDAHVPEMFAVVLLHLLESYTRLLRSCVSDLRKLRQSSPGEEGKLASAINTSLEYGIATTTPCELPQECVCPISRYPLSHSWSPSLSVWALDSLTFCSNSDPDSVILFQLRKLQSTVGLILNSLKVVLTTWPAICLRQRTAAMSTLKDLVGSRIDPLGQASHLLAFFQADGCEADLRAQESIIQLSHVHSILHDVASQLVLGPFSERLSVLAIDCLVYLRRQLRVALSAFYSERTEDYVFTDIMLLFLCSDPAVSHEALRLMLILTEPSTSSRISSRFRSAFFNFSTNDNAVATLVRAPTASTKVSATEQRIREQSWTLLRRFLSCHDQDPGRFLFSAETAKFVCHLVESLLVEGASCSAIYAAVSILCRSATPELSITVLSGLLPVLCNRSAACAIDALDEVLEFSSSISQNDMTDRAASFVPVFHPQCIGMLPESGASYLLYTSDSLAIDLCSFCARHCYSAKSSDISYFAPSGPQLSRKQCLCTHRHDNSLYPHCRRLSSIHDRSVVSSLVSSLEQFIASRIDLIGIPASRVSIMSKLQIRSYLTPNGFAAPSSGQQMQNAFSPPPDSAETASIYRLCSAAPSSFTVINQPDPLLVSYENCCVNVYQNWKPNVSATLKLCSSTIVPFKILGIYSQSRSVFLHGASDAYVLKFDPSGKRVKRLRADLCLEVLKAAAQTPVRILSAIWFVEVPRLIVVTNAGLAVLDVSNEDTSSVEPIYISVCAPGSRLKDSTLWRNRYVFAILDSGSIAIDDIIDGMGQLRDAGPLPDMVTAASNEESFPAAVYANSGAGISIHMSNTAYKLVATWSVWGTRLFNIDGDGNIVSALQLHSPSPTVTNDVRTWIDVAGAHGLVVGVAPDNNRLVVLEVSDCSAEAWSRSIHLIDRGQRLVGAVDLSPNIKTASVLLQQDNGSYSILVPESDPSEPQLVSVPYFQSFLEAPDPASSRTTGFGGGESFAWTHRDITIFERSTCISVVPIQGPASSKEFVRDIAKSNTGATAEDPKSITIAIEPEVAPGYCIVGIRALVDRSTTPQSFEVALPALKRSVDVSVSSSSPKRYYDVIFSRFESALCTSMRDRLEVHCKSESSTISALVALEVYSMPRSAFYHSTSRASLCSQHQHWPWPLSSHPESVSDFPNEMLLASSLRLCLSVCHLTDGNWNSLKSILSLVLNVAGKPCFSRLESLFHQLLMEVVPHIDPPMFPEIANCLLLCGCSGLRMLLSWRHLRAQICQDGMPSINAGNQLMNAVDDALSVLGKSSVVNFGTFLCKCPSFFQAVIEVSTRLILTCENCHVFHIPGLMSSLFEFVCEACLAIAEADASEDTRQSLMEAPMRFIAECMSSTFAAVQEAAQTRLLLSFASPSQQEAIKISKSFLQQSSSSPKISSEPAVSLSSDNDGSVPDPQRQQQQQQQRMTTIFNSAVRPVPGTRYRCDLCDICPIVGPRYHCAHPDCVDFDLCTACYGAGDFTGSTHRATHDVVLLNDNPVGQRHPDISLAGSHPPGSNLRLARRRGPQN